MSNNSLAQLARLLRCDHCAGQMVPSVESPRIVICQRWHFRLLTPEEAAAAAELVKANDAGGDLPIRSEIKWQL